MQDLWNGRMALLTAGVASVTAWIGICLAVLLKGAYALPGLLAVGGSNLNREESFFT